MQSRSRDLSSSSPTHSDTVRTIEALQVATRDLVGVAYDSLSASGGLTLAQVRLLFAIAESQSGSCSLIARRLGVAASTVTRMADRLRALGHVDRAHSPLNRSIVLLTLTDLGEETLRAVLARRGQTYQEALDAMDPAMARQVGESLAALHDSLVALGLSRHHPLF